MTPFKSFLLIFFVGFIIISLAWYFLDEMMNETWGKVFGLIGAFVIGYLISQTITENRHRKLP